MAKADFSAGSTIGPITTANIVAGTAAGDASKMNFHYDPIHHHQLVVGRPADNIVSLYVASEYAYRIFVPVIAKP